MKTHLCLLLMLLVSVSAFGHDEGHGPKLTDTGKQGGVVSPVISLKDAKKGAKADLVYKSELVRSEDGTIHVYVYDKDMKPLDLAKFDKAAKGVVEVEKKKKTTRTPFTLKLEENSFIGSPPKASSKPFNIDITLKEDGKALLTAFDNLD